MEFVKNELKKIRKILDLNYQRCFNYWEDEEVMSCEDEERRRRSSRESFLKIAVNVLRIMKQEELADRLQSSKGNKEEWREKEFLNIIVYLFFFSLDTVAVCLCCFRQRLLLSCVPLHLKQP